MSSDFLVRGAAYLERYPNFQLVGREEELKKLSGILMRSNAHSVLLIGAGGVGCSALCLGLQASKSLPTAPFDIISKRLFWLDADGLFASGNTEEMNEKFQKLLRTLSRSGDSVLIIEDTRDFVEAARNNSCTNFINALMREIRHGKFQLILEARDEDLEVVLKCHSDMRQLFTMLDIQEPPQPALNDIVKSASKRLESHHQIPISNEAVSTAIELTSKYRVSDMSLSRAQPERALNLIDRALTSFRQEVHTRPPAIARLEEELASEVAAGNTARNLELEEKIAAERVVREKSSDDLRRLYKNQRDGEELVSTLEDELAEQRTAEKLRKEQDSKEGTSGNTRKEFSAKLDAGGFESEAVNALKSQINEAEHSIQENAAKFVALTAKLNDGLRLEPSAVLQEFSKLSGIPAHKLNQDERKKLLELEGQLSQRVFGQDHAIVKLASAIRVARAGLKDPEKPLAAFMFLGPSGVGKTELAKALAVALKDDERALLRFDMSEYMEKHAAAKLIGAPPGYEGYEAGGILTNSIRRNPHVIVLFDEIEKAHPDVFNVLLQVLDDGRLTDNRGLTVSFSEAVVLMTTNIGQPNFLDPALTFEEAVAETMDELDKVYRPEFLNRFNGRENIVCFHRLELPVIEKIARREIERLNARMREQKSGLVVEMSDDAIVSLCKDKYNPANGARGIAGYFNSQVYPAIAETMLRTPDAHGAMTINYDSASKEVRIVSTVIGAHAQLV